MKVIQWFLDNFSKWQLVAAIVSFLIGSVFLVIGYRGSKPISDETSSVLNWWKQHEGKKLSENEYLLALIELVENPDKKLVVLRIIKNDGLEINGTLDALAIRDDCSVYTFLEGDHFSHARSNEIKELQVIQILSTNK